MPLHKVVATRLTGALNDWGSDSFSATLKNEIEHLAAGVLPLDKAGALGGYVDESGITVSIISLGDDEKTIQIRIGVFFRELLAGCSCGDEPSPLQAYCEIQVSIDRKTAETEFILIPD